MATDALNTYLCSLSLAESRNTRGLRECYFLHSLRDLPGVPGLACLAYVLTYVLAESQGALWGPGGVPVGSLWGPGSGAGVHGEGK